MKKAASNEGIFLRSKGGLARRPTQSGTDTSSGYRHWVRWLCDQDWCV